MRPYVRAQYPLLKNTDISSVLAQMWRDASNEEKQPYLDKEQVERNKYHIDMNKWKLERKEEEEQEQQEGHNYEGENNSINNSITQLSQQSYTTHNTYNTNNIHHTNSIHHNSTNSNNSHSNNTRIESSYNTHSNHTTKNDDKNSAIHGLRTADLKRRHRTTTTTTTSNNNSNNNSDYIYDDENDGEGLALMLWSNNNNNNNNNNSNTHNNTLNNSNNKPNLRRQSSSGLDPHPSLSLDLVGDMNRWSPTSDDGILCSDNNSDNSNNNNNNNNSNNDGSDEQGQDDNEFDVDDTNNFDESNMLMSSSEFASPNNSGKLTSTNNNSNNNKQSKLFFSDNKSDSNSNPSSDSDLPTGGHHHSHHGPGHHHRQGGNGNGSTSSSSSNWDGSGATSNEYSSEQNNHTSKGNSSSSSSHNNNNNNNNNSNSNNMVNPTASKWHKTKKDKTVTLSFPPPSSSVKGGSNGGNSTGGGKLKLQHSSSAVSGMTTDQTKSAVTPHVTYKAGPARGSQPPDKPASSITGGGGGGKGKAGKAQNPNYEPGFGPFRAIAKSVATKKRLQAEALAQSTQSTNPNPTTTSSIHSDNKTKDSKSTPKNRNVGLQSEAGRQYIKKLNEAHPHMAAKGSGALSPSSSSSSTFLPSFDCFESVYQDGVNDTSERGQNYDLQREGYDAMYSTLHSSNINNTSGVHHTSPRAPAPSSSSESVTTKGNSSHSGSRNSGPNTITHTHTNTNSNSNTSVQSSFYSPALWGTMSNTHPTAGTGTAYESNNGDNTTSEQSRDQNTGVYTNNNNNTTTDNKNNNKIRKIDSNNAPQNPKKKAAKSVVIAPRPTVYPYSNPVYAPPTAYRPPTISTTGTTGQPSMGAALPLVAGGYADDSMWRFHSEFNQQDARNNNVPMSFQPMIAVHQNAPTATRQTSDLTDSQQYMTPSAYMPQAMLAPYPYMAYPGQQQSLPAYYTPNTMLGYGRNTGPTSLQNSYNQMSSNIANQSNSMYDNSFSHPRNPYLTPYAPGGGHPSMHSNMSYTVPPVPPPSPSIHSTSPDQPLPQPLQPPTSQHPSQPLSYNTTQPALYSTQQGTGMYTGGTAVPSSYTSSSYTQQLMGGSYPLQAGMTQGDIMHTENFIKNYLETYNHFTQQFFQQIQRPDMISYYMPYTDNNNTTTSYNNSSSSASVMGGSSNSTQVSSNMSSNNAHYSATQHPGGSSSGMSILNQVSGEEVQQDELMNVAYYNDPSNDAIMQELRKNDSDSDNDQVNRNNSNKGQNYDSKIQNYDSFSPQNIDQNVDS